MGDKDRRRAESQAFHNEDKMEDQLGGGHNIPDHLEHRWETKNRRQEKDKPSEADTASHASWETAGRQERRQENEDKRKTLVRRTQHPRTAGRQEKDKPRTQ